MLKKALKSINIVYKYAKIITIIKLFYSVFSAMAIPMTLYATQRLIDSVYLRYYGKQEIFSVIVWLFVLTISLMISTSLNVINSYINISFQKKLNKKYSEDIICKFESIKYECYENSRYNDVLMRMGDRPQEKVLDVFNNVIEIGALCVTVISLVVLFFQVSIAVSIVYICLIIIMLILDFKSMNQMNEMFNNQSYSERQLDYYREILSDKNTLFELRVFNVIFYIQDKCRKKNGEVLEERLKTTINSQKFFALSSLCIVLWIGMVVFVLLNAIINQEISVGIFVSLLASVGTVLTTTESLSYKISNVAQKCFEIGYYEEFMNMPEIQPRNKTFRLTECYIIEFKNVFFKYPESDEYILKNFCFSFNLDDSYALVGENGSGKTTIVKLICRLYYPSEGEINLNGVDIYSISDEEYSRILGVVFQDFVKYDLTIRENVSLGNLCKMDDDKKIKEILTDMVHFENIDNIDLNLGKIEDDGRDLSGGEWQKIAVARALFSDGIFIVMDEPTASLDPIAESKLYETLLNVLGNRGVLLISHRMASARFSKHILFLKDGKIVESGTHSELLETRGQYYDMYQAQSSWYI